MSDRCHVPYTLEPNGVTSFGKERNGITVFGQESNGITAFGREGNGTIITTTETALPLILNSFEAPCCQILTDWIFDGSVIMNGSRTFGSDSYEA